jgi:acyl-coenzyme A thioesterase PaaI-like protein
MVAVTAGRVIAINGHRRAGEEDMVSENEGTAASDLEAAVAQMPFAEATISSSTVFTHAVRDGEVSAVSRPLHVGRTTIAVQTDLADGAGRRVAQVTQVQAVLGGDRGR